MSDLEHVAVYVLVGAPLYVVFVLGVGRLLERMSRRYPELVDEEHARRWLAELGDDVVGHVSIVGTPAELDALEGDIPALRDGWLPPEELVDPELELVQRVYVVRASK